MFLRIICIIFFFFILKVNSQINELQEESIIKAWEEVGQGHVFKYLEKINTTERANLFHQLQGIDVSQLKQIRVQAIKNEEEIRDVSILHLAQLPSTSLPLESPEKIELWRAKGMELISEGKVAVLVLAGGQGSRLGSNDPKGTYDIGLPSHKSLFQYQAERLLKLELLVKERYSRECGILWLIMTSEPTHRPTISFFEKNNYFGMKKENIIFFEQGTLPAITEEGKIIMETMSKVFVAPGTKNSLFISIDGNGGFYRALREKGLISEMKRRGIEYIFQYCVDNILIKMADPIFIGFVHESGALLGSKAVKKTDPDEKVGLLVKKDGRPSVVEYSEISKELASERDSNGDLKLRAGHICINLYHISFLERISMDPHTKYHIARKKISSIDENGNTVKVNGWKFEQFLFDPFDQVDEIAILEIARHEEFSPLKNAPESKSESPETCRNDLSNYQKSWVMKAGGIIKETTEEESLLEISPLISYDGEGLEKIVKGKTFQLPINL